MADSQTNKEETARRAKNGGYESGDESPLYETNPTFVGSTDDHELHARHASGQNCVKPRRWLSFHREGIYPRIPGFNRGFEPGFEQI